MTVHMIPIVDPVQIDHMLINIYLILYIPLFLTKKSVQTSNVRHLNPQFGANEQMHMQGIQFTNINSQW